MDKKGALHWNIKKVVSKGDYNYAVVKEHPNSSKFGYVLEHRAVMENHLGRILDDSEIVHHIDGNKKNNVIQNLELMTRAKHTQFHQLHVGSKWALLRCPHCGSLFEREVRQTHLAKGKEFTTCSRSCRGSFSRKIQLRGKTMEVQNAISENVQKLFTKFLENAEETLSRGSVETIRIPPEMEKT